MTGYTVHTGSTKQFASNWDRIFSRSKASKGAASTAKPAKKKRAKVAKKR